jgi:Skp family chaperone for outer membrane proteins
MASVAGTAKQAVHDKLESQFKAVEAKLETMKVEAEAAKLAFKIKAITQLAPKALAIRKKLQDLKQVGADHLEQAKADLQAEIADLENSAKEIAARSKES